MGYRGMLVSLLGASFTLSAAAATLDPERRLDAHRAVERVLWERRIWPEANREPKPPLEAVLPESALRARVDEVLRKSSALAALWKRPIGNIELQAEIDRMIHGSQAPDTLEAMVAALDRDPVLVAEVIARPALVDRLIRGWYAMDPRYHEAERREAEAAFAAATPQNLAQLAPRHMVTNFTLDESPTSPDRVVLDPSEWKDFLEAHRQVLEQPLGGLGPLQERDDAFTATVVLERSERSVRLAVASWPKTRFDAWWSVERARHLPTLTAPTREEPAIVLPEGSLALLVPGCSDDTWMRTGTGAPNPRRLHSAVWTGSEMIVWGGREFGAFPTDTGGRYNPATDTWTTLSTLGAPSPRDTHAAVWTGSKMIVWGGEQWTGTTNTGGRYDPFTDSWASTDIGTAPPFSSYGRAIWTGSRMIVWRYYTLPGAPIEAKLYDPVANTWTPANWAGAPLATLDPSEAVWTGSTMILWPGARYDPVADTWTPIASAGEPSPRSGHSMVWTGSRVIVWGGTTGSTDLNDGALYDPASNSWTAMSTAGAPVGRWRHTGVWVSNRMVVWGGTGGPAPLQSGGRYDPVTNAWAATALAGAPPARAEHTAIATPTQMIVWGGGGIDPSTHNTGGIYDPLADSWIPTRLGVPSPIARRAHSAVWTGAEMILWGGDHENALLDDGSAYNPATDSWFPIYWFSPSARSSHTAVWTGTAMLVWGGYEGTVPYTNTGGRYYPASDSWASMTTAGAPTGRVAHTAVWTGSRMLVWGGNHDVTTDELLDTGGSYDPVGDAWLPTSMAGAPVARAGHSGVWTGSRMVVWGGGDGFQPLNSGGRYDPITDSWTPTAVSGAPSGRGAHTAVWTGSRMLIWGGSQGGILLGDGGAYDPASDAWSPLSSSNAPAERQLARAVWTGNEMIVWAGENYDGALNSGARYRPDDDSWRATTLAGAPRSRIWHSAVWTGSRMVIWGGRSDWESGQIGDRNDGASYCSCVSWYLDGDGDGFGGSSGTVSVCDGSHPAGLIAAGGDCNDGDPAIHPGVADASCNLVDEDCDGQFDEDFLPQPSVCGLGVCRSFGSLECVNGQPVNSCVPGTPNASVDDTCNTLDDDCDGGVDDDFPAYTDQWVAIANAPSARTNYTAVSSATELLVFGGDNGSGVVQTGGIAYDVPANTWRTLPAGPAKRWHHTAVWADGRMIVWGGDDGSATIHNTGGRYDPSFNTWAATTTTGAPSARGGHSAVWTGSRMVIWGGRDVTTYFNTGSRYDPAGNGWSGTATSGAPTARVLHTAVWTGAEMIVWGGQSSTGAALSTGARYNPSSNTWTGVSTSGAPSPRYGHVAVWTGAEMIVWGGQSDATSYLANGARYDPSTNTWTPMFTTGAPSPRAWASAAYILGEVVIWGGTYRTNENPDTALADGARYQTWNNTWVPTSPFSPPSARARAAADLVVGGLIVWGGDPNGGALATGARYVLSTECGVGNCKRQGTSVCTGGSISFQCTPGAPQPESCDGYDNDCNALVDDVPVPTGVPRLYGTKLVDNTIVLDWSPTANTTAYDMVKGGLAALRTSGGDFSSSQCQQNDNPFAQGWDVPVAPPGDGTWYLVRPVNACSGSGSFDDAMPPQQGSRDAELAASPSACP